MPKERILKPLKDKEGYFHITLSRNNISKTKKIHKLVAVAFLNHTPCGFEVQVDHINGLKTENRVENLQLLNARDHAAKTFKNKGTSKYTGVSWYKKENKWVSTIYLNGKLKHLGYFTDELEASNAYQKALDNL